VGKPSFSERAPTTAPAIAESATTLARARPGWRLGIKPRKKLDVAEWSDKYRILNSKSSAEPGAWRTSRVPYLREIMDCLSPHNPAKRITFMKSAQVGGTELGNNWVGFIIDHAPAAALVVQPTVELAKLWSRQRLAPMIDDMPCLRKKIKLARSRDSGNNVLLKEFPAGLLRIGGANSAAALRSMPVKYLMLDEVDAYPFDVDGEGDPVELAINRTKTYSRKKILEISTPTIEGLSRIDRQFKLGTQEFYYCPCPHCGESQKLEFRNLKWQKDDAGEALPKTAALACVHCGVLIDEHHKTAMLEAGAWRAENPGSAEHRSFHINALYSPIGFESWAEIAQKFIEAVGNRELQKTFTNTIEGRPFVESKKQISPHHLADRAEQYPLRRCPADCLALTAGVDVQDNRLELVTVGHNGRERWIIDFHKIYGSPGNVETWRALDDYLMAPFEHDAGRELSISAAAIDSGGHFTNEVYDFCRLRKARHIIAVKGSSVRGKPVLGRPAKVDVNLHGRHLKNGAEVWQVGTDTAKDLIYNAIEIDEPDADGYIHFSKELDGEFFKQITSEKKMPRYHKGFAIHEWVLPPGRRNEALDCTVYALAAFWLLGLNRWRPGQWEQLRQKVNPLVADLFEGEPSGSTPAAVDEALKTLTPKPRRRGRKRRDQFKRDILGNA